jgi:hypothetical protein
MIVGDMFQLWSPFDLVNDEEVEKAGGKAKTGIIKGIASTEMKDSDGEIVLQDGLDWAWFKSNGYFTYEHPMNVGNIVGEPRAVERIEVDGHAATQVEGVIYLSDPMGSTVYGKALAMKKAGSSRRLGFSIEGQVIDRDGSTINKAKVFSVAISPRPKNDLTWWEPLMRSMIARGATVGYPIPQGGPSFTGNFQPVMPESLQGGNAGERVSVATVELSAEVKKLLKSLDPEDLKVAKMLKAMPTLNWSQGVELLTALKRKNSPRRK